MWSTSQTIATSRASWRFAFTLCFRDQDPTHSRWSSCWNNNTSQGCSVGEVGRLWNSLSRFSPNFAAIFLSWDQGSILAFIHTGFEVAVATKSALEVKIHNFHDKVLLNQMSIMWLLKISIWNLFLLNRALDFSRARFSVLHSEQKLKSSTQIAPLHGT